MEINCTCLGLLCLTNGLSTSSYKENNFIIMLQRVFVIFFIFFLFYRNPLMAFDFLYNSSSDGKLFKKECDFIHEVADKVIDSRRKALVIRLIA